LEALPPVKEGAKVLDFAGGAGVIAAWVRARTPDAQLTLLDADALALVAAAENVPGAVLAASDGFDGLDPAARFDLIVSNPPIHCGRQEDFAVLAAFLERGPKLLRPKGALVFVVQRTAGGGRLLGEQARRTELLKETPAFQVWRMAV
ncbi:methyltransferase, partial [bacterium]|nr:methyltransferase [bacterium]